MIVSYTRNKHLTVRDLNGSVLSRASINDTFFEAEVEVEVKVPELEILSAKGQIKRAFFPECQRAIPLLDKAVSMRVGPGITRTIKDLIGGTNGCNRLADLVFECFDAVILRFTAEQIRNNWKKPETLEEEIKMQVEYLKQNPRLLDSCIAYIEGSPFRTEGQFKKE
ncbi:MAG: DUF2889 domain-containing protein [Chloroflexi bacterium]|nr:DUF2889 domain-containing protein [Chloroflexota bacterium]